ncbi:unnamed protein product [Moneuplotes crassus]|uniref:Uncharacterized protein n=1 Tax=Euplotes crassus TaxID=5936 RepID=A0AAD1XWT9_EUPCR|nr:unnamed protein product [Moneuplotes crassus]
MKVIIALVTFAALTTAYKTLSEEGDYKFIVNFSKNSSNKNNTDAYLGLIVGSTTQPLTNSYYVTGACVNIGQSNYQLTTASTSLQGFGIEWGCASSCTSLAAIYNTVKFYAGASWEQDTSHVASSGSSLTQVTTPAGVNSYNTTDKKVMHTWTGLTPTEISSSVYFPNQTSKWYVRCFARFNHAASISLDSGAANLGTTLGNGKNLTLKGNSQKAAVFLAIAGSLVAITA